MKLQQKIIIGSTLISLTIMFSFIFKNKIFSTSAQRTYVDNPALTPQEKLLDKIYAFNKTLIYLSDEEKSKYKDETAKAVQIGHVTMDQAFDFYKGLTVPADREKGEALKKTESK